MHRALHRFKHRGRPKVAHVLQVCVTVFEVNLPVGIVVLGGATGATRSPRRHLVQAICFQGLVRGQQKVGHRSVIHLRTVFVQVAFPVQPVQHKSRPSVRCCSPHLHQAVGLR